MTQRPHAADGTAGRFAAGLQQVAKRLRPRIARMTAAERRLVHSAPRPEQGFVSRRIRVDGYDLHVRTRNATGMPWVLLHGLAVSHRYLMPTAAALPGPVHVPDLPGFGRSAHPASILDTAQHAAVVAHWMDREGLTRAAVLGNSFGCQVAVELAVRRPDLAAALILVGPTTDPAAASVGGQIQRWVRDVRWEDKGQAWILAADVHDAGLRRVSGTLRHSVRHRIERRLPLLRAPVLLVRGEHDPIVPPSWIIRAAALTPGAATAVVPGAGHNATTTAGTETAALAGAFLDRALRSAP
jgi:pimeloyl-ACP methyl ester carboxylesterase